MLLFLLLRFARGRDSGVEEIVIEDIAIMAKLNNKAALIYLKDYRQPDYLIDKTYLQFDLQGDVTLVRTRLEVRRNPSVELNKGEQIPLMPIKLDGVNLELRSLAINGKVLDESDYRVDDQSLIINSVPASFTLECITAIKPKENTALVGLYQTQGLYCTQCEPQGFRHMTYYLDRPDILSEFTVTLEADKAQYPILLANGNLVGKGDVDSTSESTQPLRHWATWHDPFKKPSYLFAMVAGKLHAMEEPFITYSGRKVTIRIFTENEQDLAKCHHAMHVTKEAMAWDERVYGREYDLDSFMIAVITKANFGGMENKGLNIYRADRLLIDPQTTCDGDIQSMTETIAHEYFHNWSGNRVTCRDWFQLSLKEGFTTYRGLQFCQDTYSAAVKRIEETLFIRTTQFAEDASPLVHPIRPEAYRAIWNFYTPTVYQKGAEVARMLNTLLGQENYRKGTDLFFDRHDGQAATTDDFIASMEAASNRDFSQFKHWYSQAGTPRVAVNGEYDAELQQFTLTVKQTCPPTSECQIKKPFHIPLVLSLLGQEGALPLVLKTASDDGSQLGQGQDTLVLEVTEPQQTFVFEQVSEDPVPSLFRDFSAPVKWTYDYSRQDLLRLIQKESSGVCRWEASQLLWIDIIHQTMNDQLLGNITEVPTDIIEFYQGILLQVRNAPNIDQALIAQLLTLPSEAYLSELVQPTDPIDVVAIHKARCAVKKTLALLLKKALEPLYGVYQATKPVSITPAAMAQRALRNLALDYLANTGERVWLDRCYQQFLSANNMTDTMAALVCLMNSEADYAKSLKQQALAAFYDRWQHQPLVINQWLAVQACCPLPGTLVTVKALMDHPAFEIKSPNQVLALIGSFCTHNAINFHYKDGSGYQFLVDQVMKLDEINPQIASRTLARSPLINWKRYDNKQQDFMKAQLQRLQALPTLSNEVFEVVDKCF